MSYEIEHNLPESVTNKPKLMSEGFRIAKLPTVLRSKPRMPSKTTLAILGLSAITFLAVRDYNNLYNTAAETVEAENPGMSVQSIKDQDSKWRNYLGEAEYIRLEGPRSLVLAFYLRDGFVQDEMENQFGARKTIDGIAGKAGVVGLLGLGLLKVLGFSFKRSNPASLLF